MNRMNKILLCGLLLCLLGAAGKGYGQEVKPGTVLWKFNTQGSIYSSPAIGPDGCVYIGSNNGLYAISKNGSEKWRFSGNTYSTPAIDTDNNLYMGSGKLLYSINKKGKKNWEYKVGGWIYTSSPAIGNDGTIYIGSSGDNKKLHAINPNGSKKWEFDVGDFIEFSPVVGIDGTVYVGSGDTVASLFAVNPDGSRRWSYKVKNQHVSSSAAVDFDGTIYFQSRDRYTYAVSPNGHTKWEIESGNGAATPSIGSDGTIYIIDRTKLGAITKKGQLKWEFKFSAPGASVSSPAVGNDGTIYVGSEEGSLYAVKSDGSLKWSVKTGDNIMSSPVIGDNGMVYVGSYDNSLYAVKSSSSGPSESPWPMYRQNARRTGQAGFGKIEIIKHPISNTIDKGEVIDLKFTAKGAFPRTYQWQRNGEPIPGATKPSLTIENATSKDSGLYRVTITNKHGSVTSDEAVLKVVSPGSPQIFADGKEVVGECGQGREGRNHPEHLV